MPANHSSTWKSLEKYFFSFTLLWNHRHCVSLFLSFSFPFLLFSFFFFTLLRVHCTLKIFLINFIEFIVISFYEFYVFLSHLEIPSSLWDLIFKKFQGAWQMAQLVKSLENRQEDLSSIPRIPAKALSTWALQAKVGSTLKCSGQPASWLSDFQSQYEPPPEKNQVESLAGRHLTSISGHAHAHMHTCPYAHSDKYIFHRRDTTHNFLKTLSGFFVYIYDFIFFYSIFSFSF